MKIKAISFDIGHTLVKYNNPLNWKSLYEPALTQAAESCGFYPSEEHIKSAAAILTKYNTRENPREREVTSEVIFKEIFDVWKQAYCKINAAKAAFYGFFQADALCFDDAEETLKKLKSRGIKIGALTDVAYGMDNLFSLADIVLIQHYFDLALTSVDVGYRKPNAAGFSMLLEGFEVLPHQMLYVGDEEKDIAGANALGIVSVLIDRSQSGRDFGQKHTIYSLTELCGLIYEPEYGII